VQQFSWERSVQRIHTLYMGLLGQPVATRAVEEAR
jgi:hypothetical protein